MASPTDLKDLWRSLSGTEKYFLIALGVLTASELWLYSISPGITYALLLSTFFIKDFSLKNLSQEQQRHKRFAILYISHWALHIIALLWTDNLSEGVAKLDIKSGLIALPLIFSSIPTTKWRKWMPLIKRGYLLLLLATALLCLGRATYLSIEAGSVIGTIGFNFTYSALALWIMHPGYLSMFFSAGIIWLAFDGTPWKVSKIAMISFLLLFTFLLSSRGILLALVIALSAGMIYAALRLRSKKIIAAILILPVILILSLFLLPDSIVGRYKQVFSSEQFTVVEGQETYNSIQSRLVQWDSALEIISKHPWLGVSPGDAQAELRVKYKEKQFGVGLSEGYNAHNGFLQDQLALGVLGGAFWLLFFVMNFRWALREDNVILFVFWVLFATAILTESILERNWGVYWLMLFTWIFAVGRSVDPQDGNKEAHK
ncbi:MAG: hypothetical protein SchgKO_10080 [Schleiferiaceae bacterium]